MQSKLPQLASQCNLTLTGFKPIAGGDINEVFLLNTDSGPYVVKLNNADRFPGMFEAEAKGLDLLRSTDSFRIPSVIATGDLDDTSFLLLEYIEPGKQAPYFWSQFAKYLATLHKETRDSFGLDHDNYIGSLPQQNNPESNAAEFYLLQRLEPQFKLASERSYRFNDLDLFFKNASEIIPNEVPALLHGDLWNGNFMTDIRGTPVLIDPAVAYGPREMDLGMMQLFGGFSPEVFDLYHELYPLIENWKDRIALWQLYYLLVHLNLFGSGYLGSVRNILARYT